MSQLVSVLDANWGKGWDCHFRQFSFTPVAASSIGQVHLAETRDKRRLAIKVQYPGIRRSIDSDIDNVATLLRFSGLLPEVHADLTTESVLVMSCMGGAPVDSLQHAPQAERDRVAGLLFRLLFREIFEFRMIQTDPDFANYRYDGAFRRLILLDFGATRPYPAAIVDAYRRLMASAVVGDRQAMSAAASAIGYFRADIGERQLVPDVFLQACEPLRHAGAYDFGHSDLLAAQAGRSLPDPNVFPETVRESQETTCLHFAV